MLEKIKYHFFDNSGALTGFSLMYIFTAFIVVVVILCSGWSWWLCSNYQKVTGKATHFIPFDACYVENSDGEMIRYDSYYKGQ